ncbi:uncharacterized protein CBL_05392 [Carabus blaptoides fortunei]
MFVSLSVDWWCAFTVMAPSQQRFPIECQQFHPHPLLFPVVLVVSDIFNRTNTKTCCGHHCIYIPIGVRVFLLARHLHNDFRWQILCMAIQGYESMAVVAEVAVAEEGAWSLHYYHETEDGKKKYYRCNKLKRRGPQCSARIYLLFETTSDAVLMFRADADHDHDKKMKFSSSYGLSDTVKSEIDKLFELKMKPKAIMHNLTKMKDINIPKYSQLRNYLSERRRAKYDQQTVSLGELETWILSHTKLPMDSHEAFVISYNIDDETTPAFCFAISTKYLIDISKDASVVHADTTYKINWQGFPVFVCGTTDQNHKFHPLCLAVASNERKEDFKLIFEGLQNKIQEYHQITWKPKVLVCDAAESIQNAFLEVFGDNVLVRICWAHVKKNIQARVERIINKQLRIDILADVDALHSITRPNIFNAASEAFLQKYKDQTEFVDYFKEHWLIENRNWFLGAAANSPSTNNALASFNKLIKDSNILRERFPLSRFLAVATEMVNQWSMKYTTNPEDNTVAKVRSISLKDWTDSYQWAKNTKEVSVLRNDDAYTYYQIPASQAKTCEVFDKQWKSFDSFKKQYFSKWLVSLPINKDDWRRGKLCFIAGLTATPSQNVPEPGSRRKACSFRGILPQPPGRVDTTQRLTNLREHMVRESAVEGHAIDAYIITSGDEHQSEVVAVTDRRREYISGFSGSSGDAIVTLDKAALWTDGRYHIQADEEINCKWLLMKQGRSEIPTAAEWLKRNLKPGSRIGADPKLIPNTEWTTLKKQLENSSIHLVEVRKNLIDLIWIKDRPPASNKLVYEWEMKYAGKTWIEKVTEVREELAEYGADAMVVTALDEIAWLLNIRGRDIPNSPFVTSYVILSMEEIHFYVDNKKIKETIQQHLQMKPGGNPRSVTLHEYDDIWTSLRTLSQQWHKILLPSKWVYTAGVSRAIYTTVPEEKRLSKPSPIMYLKAQKNEVEIQGMETASIRDSAALIDFLSYFEEQFHRGEYWDELKVIKTLDQYRYAQKLGKGSSFETIAAFGPNGAKPHYESSNITNLHINKSSTLLLDSGGQYLDGTTDVTRTLHFGIATEEQRHAYTKVLMGAIDLSSLVFPSNLKTYIADVMARAPLWDDGLDYMHGTGHGVGAFLGVHESPISVSYLASKDGQTFHIGNFFSNEPGYYKEGEFGIRLENVLEVIHKYQGKKHYTGEIFLGFKDITLVPYEPKLINNHMLTVYHKRWLNDYNTRIRSFVGAELKKQKKMSAFYWMMEKTKNIPEYGSYSTAHKHTPYMYIVITAFMVAQAVCCHVMCQNTIKMDLANLEPNERIKRLASYSDSVDVDPNVPTRRYYRSGLEMVRMANVYLDEGSLENAYVLYMKFMTLFIEKIRKHPEYSAVSANIKQTNNEKLREVLPKAEKLKSRLIEQYTREYAYYLEQQKIKQQRDREARSKLQKTAEEEEREKLKQRLRSQGAFDKSKGVTVVHPISIDNVLYPDASNTDIRPSAPPELRDLKPVIPNIIPSANTLDLPSVPGAPPSSGIPSFDRGTKPSSLLSPSLHSKSFALRTVIVPSRLMPSFLNIAHRNTTNNVETCGILAGKLERDNLIITHMIVPKQKGTPDSCVTMNEEELFDFQDQHNLITVGWIHTHPTQTAFLSSVDLHTHCSYQTMMPEAIAIVCAPKYEETGFFMLTPEHGLGFIASCRESGFHPHPKDPPLFKKADHTKVDSAAFIEVVDLRT